MCAQTTNKEQAAFLKKSAVCASIFLAVSLCILKVFGAIYTDSLAVLSSLIDSLADVFASAVSFVAIKIALRPASCEHRYGFGKAESISALLQSAFIAGSGMFVLYDGIARFFNPVALKQTTAGIAVMLVSLFATIFLIMFQRYVAKKTNSIAIRADSAHYTVDVITNAAIIISLLVVEYFHFLWFDSLAACFVSAYLLWGAYKIAKSSLYMLTDSELDESIRKKVADIVLHVDGVLGIHDFRSRDLGGQYMFEIHVEINGNVPLYTAHEISDNAENAILAEFPDAQIIVHQDPYGLKENRLDYTLPNACQKV